MGGGQEGRPSILSPATPAVRVCFYLRSVGGGPDVQGVDVQDMRQGQKLLPEEGQVEPCVCECETGCEVRGLVSTAA